MFRQCLLLIISLCAILQVFSFSASFYSNYKVPSRGTHSRIPILSANTILSVANDTISYRHFEGSNNIVQSVSGSRSYFAPLILQTGSPKDVWKWWKDKKGMELELLKSIISPKADITDHFEAYKPYLLLDKSDVLQCNADFFYAMATNDLELMKSLWLKRNESLCLLSANSDVITGYENIIMSFENHFYGSSKKKALILDQNVVFMGDMAVVTCLVDRSQNYIPPGSGSSKSKRRASMTKSYATNVFIKPADSDRYSLLAHIGSQIVEGDNKAISALRNSYRDPSRPKVSGRRSGMSSLQGFITKLNGNGEMSEESEEDDDDVETDVSFTITGAEDGESDEGSEADSDGSRAADNLKERIRSTLKTAMARMAASGRSISNNGGLVIIGGPGGGQVIRNGFQTDQNRDGGGRSGSDLDRSSSADDDDDDDDEEDEGKKLAARTLLALQWLCSQGRLTKDEKRILTADVISRVSSGQYSQTEVAFSLLVEGGRPGEVDGDDLPMDLNVVEEDDMLEFESVCHAAAKRLALRARREEES